MNSHDLWNNFKVLLQKSLKDKKNNLKEAWRSSDSRTKFYKDELLPVIAKLLGMDYETEKIFLIDAYFYNRAVSGYHIPKIFIELENDFKSTDREIRKLCSVIAPLKVIFICVEWEENRDKILEGWQTQIDELKENGLSGYLGVIIADWRDSLKFYSFAYDNSGNVIDKETIIFER